MGRNPDWEMICAQANLDLARDMGANVRDIITSPEFREVFPDITLSKDAKAAGRWVVNNPNGHNGVYFSAGVGGTIIGRGANILNIDDPLDGKGALSPVMRKAAAQFYFGDALERLMSPGLQLFTTTRRHEDDLAGRILPPESEWIPTDDPRVFKAIASQEAYADPEIWWILNLQAIQNEGTENEIALWPGIKKPRYPLSRLRQKRDRLFKQGYSREWYAQYQQIITPEEGAFCKRDWFAERYSSIPNDLWIYATSDVAITDESMGHNPDYTEHAIYGLEGLKLEYDEEGKMLASVDSVYILDWWAGRVSPDKWVDSLVEMFKEWKPNYWFGTKGLIRNAIEGYLRRELRQQRVWVPLEWLSDVKDKAAKGKPLQGMASQGRILFPKHKPWTERVIQQLCSFPYAAKDDAFDTCANMVRSLGEIPEAFIGAPQALPDEPIDCYELVPTRQRKKLWKCV